MPGRLPEAVFLAVERDPIATAASLLRSRERFFGDREHWYSAKPPEYPVLQGLSPAHQVAGQVHHTQRHVREGLAALPPHRGLSIRYEDFCARPAVVWSALRERLAVAGETLPTEHPGPPRFEATGRDQVPPRDAVALERAFASLED